MLDIREPNPHRVKAIEIEMIAIRLDLLKFLAISKTIIITTKLYKNISLIATGEPEICPVTRWRSMRIGRESLSNFCSLTYPSKLLFLISKNRDSLRISSLCYRSILSLQGHLLPRSEHLYIGQVLVRDTLSGESMRVGKWFHLSQQLPSPKL